MRNIYLGIVLFVITFLGGFMAGVAKTKNEPLLPQPEVILDDAGSRVVARTVTTETLKPIAPLAGRVRSDVTATVQSVTEPEKKIDLHIQEIETPDGPRVVIEAPDGFHVIQAKEIRVGPPAPKGIGNLSLGIAGRAGFNGASVGIMAGYSWHSWTVSAIGFKDMGILSASYRF